MILPALREALETSAKQRPEKVAAVFSPWMTVEEAYLLARYLKTLSPKIATRSPRPASKAGRRRIRRTFTDVRSTRPKFYDPGREGAETAGASRERSCSISRARPFRPGMS